MTRYPNLELLEYKAKQLLSQFERTVGNHHIYYLNQEENRYLAELRDALLPDLMSGKIELN